MSTKYKHRTVAPNVAQPEINVDCWAVVTAKRMDEWTGIIETEIRNCQRYARKDMLTCGIHEALEFEARALKRMLASQQTSEQWLENVVKMR